MTSRLSDLVRPELKQIAAYSVPAERAPIKLDANESAFPLSARARARIGEALAAIDAHRYPDPRATQLRELVSAKLNAKPDELIFGSGSDEIIALLSTALTAPRTKGVTARVLVPTPSFVMYKITASAHGLQTLEVPLTATCNLDEPAMSAALAREHPHVVYFATPNNPTGNAYDAQIMRALVAAHPTTLFVIDEAYVAFQGFSLASWFDEFPNVAIMGTLSKIGFAAARVGWIRLPRELAVEVDKARQPFNLNAYSQAVAILALTELAPEIDEHIRATVSERARVMAALSALPYITPFKSDANFIFAETARSADEVQSTLKERGILVRSFHKHGGALTRKLRISIGTPAENDALLATIAGSLA